MKEGITMIVKRDRSFFIEEVDYNELVQTYGSPLYVYSQNEIDRRIMSIYETMKDIQAFHLGFALKANNNIHLLNHMLKKGLWMDVVNHNEYTLARNAGVQNGKIVVNGNGKTREFLVEMIKSGVYAINIDSFEEYEQVREIAGKNGLNNGLPHFFLRVNPDVNPSTHPYISTGLKENKFGVHMETAHKILSKDRNLIEGLHTHIGSNIFDISAFRDAFMKLSDLINEYPALRNINIGGGWGIDYKKMGNTLDLEQYKAEVIPVLKSLNIPVMMEIGRYILGPSGILLSKVIYTKRTEHKNFLVCDTNMSNMIRPALYSAYHHIIPLTKTERRSLKVDVVGGLCETGDRLGKDRDLPPMENGEYIALCEAGAYGYSMASNYNAVTRPAEVLVSGNRQKHIRKLESVPDLMKNMEL